MSLIVHRAPRADQLADGLADLLRDAAGRPVRPGAGAGPGTRRRALAEPAALAPAGSRRGPRGRGLRRGASSARRPAWSPRSPAPASTTRGRRTRWSGRCSTVVDASAGEAWCRTLSLHLGHGQEGEEGELRRGRRYAVARRLARLFASYAVQRPTLLADWEAGRRHRRSRWRPPDRPRLAARALAPAGRRGRRADARQRHAACVAGAAPRRRSRWTCRRGSRCSGTPGSPSPRWSCSPRSVSTATSTCGCRTPPTALWDALVGPRGAVPRRADDSHERVGHPLLASLGRDVRELQRDA